MTADRIRVAVVGTGRWAQVAHIPGWQRDPRAEVVALADVDEAALAATAAKFAVGRTTTDYRELLGDPGIDVVDVVTGNRPHFQVSWDALSAGQHVLCEKPVHMDYRKTRQAAELAASRGLRTKLGFTFRYAPAIRYAKELINSGFVGEPYIFNGYEQNSQWIDPATPLRQFDPDADPAQVAVSSIEGYGAPIIDIMHWWLDRPLTAVVGTMRNFVPERVVRDTGKMTRANIDDGDMWIAEFGPDVLASIQSSYVTVGNYPGIEARIYGSSGWWTSSASARRSGRRPRAPSSSSSRRSRPGSSRPAATPASRGTTCSTPTWSATSPVRSSTPGGSARATSPRARWCRRPSTRSRRPTGLAPG